MRKIVIKEDIWERFPDFKRGVVVVSNIKNVSSHPGVERMLRDEVERRSGGSLLESDAIKSWEAVYRKLGVNPNKFPPSIKALLKRVEKGNQPPFINLAVALFNYISIKYLLPCGGDDVHKTKGDLCLGFSKGKENFIPLGSDKKEIPEQGEVIYYDSETFNVMCRKWNWRNGDVTKITEKTKRMVINIDGIGNISRLAVEKARNELADLLSKHGEAELEVDVLDIKQKEKELPI